MSVKENDKSAKWMLTEFGFSIVSRVQEILKSSFIKDYFSHVDVCTLAVEQLASGTAYDPQNNFFRIHAMLTHNQQHSIPYTKILEEEITLSELKERAGLLEEINTLVQMLWEGRDPKNPKLKRTFEWIIVQA